MLNKMKIGPKLIGGFLIVALIAAVMGIYGVVNLKAADDRDTLLYENGAAPFEHVVDIATFFQRVRVNYRDLLRAPDKEKQEYFVERTNGILDSIQLTIKNYEKTMITDAGKKLVNDFEATIEYFGGDLKKFEALVVAGKSAEAAALMDGDLYKSTNVAQEKLEQLVQNKIAAGKEIADNNTVVANRVMATMIIIVVLGVLSAIALGIFLTVSITRPLTQGVTMMQEMSKGHLGIRLKMNRQDEIGQLASAMDEFSNDLQKNVVATIVKIGDGDVSADLKPKDSQDEITPAIINTIGSIRGLIGETGMLRKAAIDGKLATRGQADKFKGGYRDIVQGVNETLDAVIGPLNVAAEYVDRISKGDIPPKITDNYNGDFNEIKNNLNQCIEALNGLIDEMNTMSHQHDLGEIDVVIGAEKFQGAYRDMGDGVNKMVSGHIAVKKKAMACIAEFGKGNFDAPLEKFPGKKAFINDTIEMLRSNLKKVSAEINILIKAAAEGELDKRANADIFQGDWKQVVSGINDTVVNIVSPLMVTADYVDKISKGIIPPEITTVYKGQYNVIKVNLNQCIEALKGLIIEDGGMVLEAAANKDLTKRLVRTYQNQFNTMKDNINKVVESLDAALQQVAMGTEQVSSAGQQISSGSQSLAQGANEQASSLEEVSSSLEEMASMTKQNAENANQAKNLANEANGNAAQGKQAMARMSDSINKIKESSDQTAKIVKTIDEIAMQTNLLALNAAVEAARAGEAGRGFAVVAEEVRNLAQRSAEAAKNTANMIEESVKNAEDGVTIAAEVSKSFEEIATSNAKVDGLIAEIAAASQEQSQGIDQINTAVAQMDKVTQQNAANSEESASAAEELSSQAEELQSMVTQFKLSHTAQAMAVKSVVHHQPVMQHAKPALEQKSDLRRKNDGNRSGKALKSLAHYTGKEIDPKKVLPLEDDDVLKEF